jgi:hypothetical protein
MSTPTRWAFVPRTLAAILASSLSIGALAQTGTPTLVTGTISGPLGTGVTEHVTFSCTGTPTCTGQYTESYKVAECNNSLDFTSTVTITGLNLATTGSIQGNITMASWAYEFTINPDRSCAIIPGTLSPATFPWSGAWNSATSTGTMNMRVFDEFTVPGTFKATVSAPPPVFPMTVRSNIDAVRATATADIQYRPQDVGSFGRVFVFALAPATRVSGGLSAEAMKVGLAIDEKKADTPIACVLAQLSSSGQMTAVSSANLSAYLTGVLSSQGASVSILNNVSTPNVAGATFFVGYGSDGTTMINSGVNRAAVTVPGSLTCVPRAPQIGWWWNPLEDGRGYSVEVRGHNIFFASFLYDVSGRSAWYVSSGPVSLEGSYYSGPLLAAAGGQTLGGAYFGRPAISTLGDMTLTFHNESSGTLVWPGGTVPIQRFNIVTNGLNLPAVAGQPESGWWWNPAEDGRGFFMEWQNGWLDIAGYMYDDAGNPVWYLTVGQISGTSTGRFFLGQWWSYGNGMTLYGPWQQHQQTSNNVAPLTITFTSSTTALMMLPNGRTTTLQRHRF